MPLLDLHFRFFYSVGTCFRPHSLQVQGAFGVPWTKRRHGQWYTISFISVADIVFPQFSFCVPLCFRMLRKKSLFSDIPQEVPDIDPDDQFVPLVLLFLDLLLDDAKDGGIFLPPGSRGRVDLTPLEGRDG